MTEAFTKKYALCVLGICVMMACFSTQSGASPHDVYQQAIQLAASGKDDSAAAMLKGAAGMLRGQDVWRQRMLAAAGLLDMRKKRALKPLLTPRFIQAELAGQYMHDHPSPERTRVWVAGLLATVFPGAGHAWLSRWHDAGVVAIMVWPMLLLTVWAAKRRMGPVTVFFGLITVWLWSGTAFSAVSLAERGSVEAYLLWWQGIWQASGLPGRPW